jgi:hypothetical protein
MKSEMKTRTFSLGEGGLDRGCGPRPSRRRFDLSGVLRLVLRTQPRPGSLVTSRFPNRASKPTADALR